MKKYTLFAGVNGAGKTSIYKSVFFNEKDMGKRINTDEMVARIGSWQDNNLQIKVGREAVRMIDYYIRNDISFHQETTLSGKSIIKNIKKAKENGFFIVMNYIGLENSEIAKVRVRFRVSKGGHGIPDEVIEKRYAESLLNLKDAIKICNEVNIFDNTNEFIQLINIKNGKLVWRDNIIPKWANTILKEL
ncbi:ATPase [Clostridium beijerinckii]|uniref:ATPase n=1 Tax=Clostridium beijerinckii TaxID=1520 RepID=UPI001494FA67|nr:ATPase [Clostridium beijerinckii]NOW04491.1 putative ABC-type ATPase [Clostridium beijerinckii]NYC02367.1 putative ABC-type ATPase [Clostridium beijerinckii]